MRILPISNYSYIKTSFTSSEAIVKNKLFDKKIESDAQELKDDIQEAVRRSNIDMKIPGYIINGAGKTKDILLRGYNKTIYGHTDTEGHIERIFTVSDNKEGSISKHYIFDKETQELKDYIEN